MSRIATIGFSPRQECLFRPGVGSDPLHQKRRLRRVGKNLAVAGSDGVDARRRHQCAKVEVLLTRLEGGVRGRG
jgi:hypothetical protein